MPASLQSPLTAKNGRTLKVLGIARISTEHQDARSLDDQEALLKTWLTQATEIPFELTMKAGRGSGEKIERKEILEAASEIETGAYDLVIAEDLGRIFRRHHVQLFCELCEDCDTRLVAINDHVDTSEENWRLSTFFATFRHELYNSDTIKRIRRTLRNRFVEGGVVQYVIYGYIKPEGAKLDSELMKDPAAERVYEEWFQRLEQGATFGEIADWLNDQGIPTGKHCRKPRWDGPMVSRVTHNPILKGLRVRNNKISKRINKTGARRSVPAPPNERLERQCPHLAFINPARYDRIIRQLDRRNARHRRKGNDGIDQRKNVPKKRTAWPGQHLRCGVCGRLYRWTGTSQRKVMMW